MKKLVLFLGLMMVVSMALTAQASGNEQRLVGTWTSLHNGDTFVFNANGTVSGAPFHTRISQRVDNFVPTHWAAAGDRLVLYVPGGHRATRAFSISSDGRTLIIQHAEGDWGTALRRN